MKRLLAVLLLGLFAATAGCAQEVGDIDRTQPNYVSKDLFSDGKPWFVRKQVIEVPYTTGFTFVGEMGNMEKVVWDIQADYLIAYRAHEEVADSEQFANDMANQNRGENDPQNEWQGAPIAAYKIESHFDIQREYNPQTGEETNVIVENSSDRHWYEREYIRVDWSQNLIADFSFVADSITTNPVQYYIPASDTTNPDRAIITSDYIDIVEKIFAEPEVDAFLSSYYQRPIPACWLYSSLYFDCMGQTIKIRTSFLKVDENNDYERLQYDDKAMDKFGYFRSERYAYDQERDLLEGKRILSINRWNIWQKSKDEAGNSIPYTDRKIKPIVYYLSENFPPDLADISVGRMADEWNRSFKETAKVLLEKEDASQVDDVFVVCRNPVQESDHPVCGCPDRIADPEKPHCGNLGLRPRLGDLRYSMIYWVATPQASAPLGYGPSSPDAETGEIINGSANIYGASLDTYAVQSRDLINLLNGKITEEDFADSKHIKEYLEGLKERRSTIQATKDLRLPSEKLTQLRENNLDGRIKRIQQSVKSGVAYNDMAAPGRESVRRSPETGALYTDELARAMSGTVTDTATGAVADFPNEFLTYWLQRDARKQESLKLQMLTRNCIFMPEFLDNAILSLAAKVAHMEQDELLQYLREEIYIGVTLHELGHTVGLRHNFAASTDAINFHDDYWDLRLNNAIDPNHPYKFVPTWTFDYYKQYANVDMEKGWNESGIMDFQYSSIMDYGARFNSDFKDLGKYDDAAIKFGYGQLVEVFDYDDFPRENYKFIQRTSERHYTTFPKLLSPIGQEDPAQWVENIRTRKTIPYAELKEQQDADANTAPVEVPYRFCTDEYAYPMGYPGAWYCNIWDAGADTYEITKSWMNSYDGYYVLNNFKRDRVSVTEAYIYSSYIGKLFRTFNNITSMYKHFVNDAFIAKSDVNCPDLNLTVRSRALRWEESDTASPYYASFLCGYDRLMASMDMVDFFARILQTPDVGAYKLNAETGRMEFVDVNPNYPQCGDVSIDPNDPECQDADGNFDPTRMIKGDYVEIPSGLGKHQVTLFDRDEYGIEFWFKPVRIGGWWDKIIAMMAMADPMTNFMGMDASSDTRSFLINTKALWPDEITNLIGGYIAEMPEWYAPYVVMDQFGGYEFFYNSPFEPGKPNNAIVVDPEEQYTCKLYGAYIAASEFSWGTDDLDFVQNARIMLKGNGEEHELPPGVTWDDEDKVVQVWDPITNRTYYAVKYQSYDYQDNLDGEGNPVPNDKIIPIGYTLLKNIKDKYGCPGPNCDMQAINWEMHYINILRGYMHAAEYPTF